MALDRNPKKLSEERERASEFARKHLVKYKDMLDAYTSAAYRHGISTSNQENHYYEFIRLTTSRVIHNNPRTRVKTRRAGSQKSAAKAIESGLNRWCVDYDARALLRMLYGQMCFAIAPVLTTVEQRPWFDPRTESIPSWPACYRLQPDRFFFDPVADSFETARYVGHTYVRDFDDIEEAEKEEGWDIEALRSAKRGDDWTDSGTRRMGRDYIPDRNEVVLHEMWIPEWEIGDPAMGFNGALVTLIDGNGEKFVREPRPFYGPRWGPYTAFGVYPVPNDPYPLSPFAATFEQVNVLNKVVAAANKAICEYKRLVLVPADNPDLLNKIKSAGDGLVLPVVGLNKEMVLPLEIGGITAQHLAQIEQQLARVDRNTGIGEVQRGNVEADATATAVSVAESSTDASLSYIKQQFESGTRNMLRTVAWYLYHDDRIEFPVEATPEMVDPMTGMPMVEPWFVGGSFDPDSGATFDDLELEIEPYSMEMSNDALQRAQMLQQVELAITLADFAAMHPEWDVKAMLREVGQTFNNPGIEDWYNADMANMMVGMPGLQQAAYPPAQGPQLSKAGDKPKNAKIGPMQGALQRTATAGMPKGVLR